MTASPSFGGFNLGDWPDELRSFDPEYLWNLETGVKTPLLMAIDATWLLSLRQDRPLSFRERLGLRVQGVLVGDRETLGLLQTCDDIFWLRDWRRFAGDTPQREAFVPVHTASLTALYFPNALNARATATAAKRPAPRQNNEL